MTPQQIWHSQSAGAPRISLEYVRHNASNLERRIRWRNALEYGGCVIACALFGSSAWQELAEKPVRAAAAICFGLFALYGVYQRHRIAGAEPGPADAGVLDTLRYQRRQFERQLDWRRRGWRYGVLILLPGFALAMASAYFEYDPVPWSRMGVAVLMAFGAAGAMAWRSELGARRLRREIEALDSLAEPKQVIDS
jgi:hypothetical protein